MNKTISITLEEYESLSDSKLKLDALEAMGVDNWEGYRDAMAYYREMIEVAKESSECF